jgi:hypothetical protein
VRGVGDAAAVQVLAGLRIYLTYLICISYISHIYLIYIYIQVAERELCAAWATQQRSKSWLGCGGAAADVQMKEAGLRRRMLHFIHRWPWS